MSYTPEIRADYDTRISPLHKAVATLQRQYLDTADLLSHVDHAREVIGGSRVNSIRSLLDGLSEELGSCLSLVKNRMRSLSPELVQFPRTEVEPQAFWRLFRTDGSDCSGHLEALLSGYVHYARATSDSMNLLEMLGDTESVAAMKQIFGAADKGIWFIELYMEGLALRMDTAQLPKFTADICDSVAHE